VTLVALAAAGLAFEQSPVLVKGTPPLTEEMVGRYTEFFGATAGKAGPVIGECSLAAVPTNGNGHGEDLNGHYESEWRRLTYPTGRMPEGGWQRRARDYIAHAMDEAAPAVCVNLHRLARAEYGANVFAPYASAGAPGTAGHATAGARIVNSYGVCP
jgi:hypothetical protein